MKSQWEFSYLIYKVYECFPWLLNKHFNVNVLHYLAALDCALFVLSY